MRRPRTLAAALASAVAATATHAIAVVGGTGAYEGARGTLNFGDVQGGSQDTFRLLP